MDPAALVWFSVFPRNFFNAGKCTGWVWSTNKLCIVYLLLVLWEIFSKKTPSLDLSPGLGASMLSTVLCCPPPHCMINSSYKNKGCCILLLIHLCKLEDPAIRFTTSTSLQIWRSLALDLIFRRKSRYPELTPDVHRVKEVTQINRRDLFTTLHLKSR